MNRTHSGMLACAVVTLVFGGLIATTAAASAKPNIV
jgi:hypothetical protein